MKVWVMELGEFNHGGHVIGVYYTKQDAAHDLLREAQELGRSLPLNRPVVDADGSVRVDNGLDWLKLTPMEVKGNPAAGVGWVCVAPTVLLHRQCCPCR